MATVRPPHLAPLPPPPAPPAAPSLPRSSHTRSRRAGDHGRKESVAESRCPAEAVNVVIDVDSGSDDDGCGSCVEAKAVEGRTRKGTTSSGGAESAAAVSFGRRVRVERQRTAHAGDDDPKAAAARRQEEDRKFWEACPVLRLP